MNNWAENIIREFRRGIRPLRLTIELTNVCNYNCIHCYHPNHNSIEEISLQEIIDTVKQFKKMGLLHVTLTGGEPFTRPDLLEIINEISKLHIKIDVYTNASLINNNNISLLKHPSISNVQISIYANKAETYNHITGSQNNFDKFCNAINLLTYHQIDTVASVIVMKENYFEFDDMVKLCQKHGFKIQYGLRLLNDRNDFSHKNIELSNEQKKYIIKKSTHFTSKDNDYDCYNRKNDYLCTAGVKGYNLTASGEITPCTGYYRPLGNIRDMKVADILNSPDAIEIKNTRFRDLKKCQNCNNIEYCAICPGVLYSENHQVKNFTTTTLCDETIAIKQAFIE